MRNKVCTKCGIKRPVSEFYKQSTGTKDGLQRWCGVCQRKQALDWRNKNVDRARHNYRAWRENNKEYCTKRDSIACMRKYGVSPEIYEDMLKNQGGVCSACGCEPNSPRARNRRLYIDHNHKTGKVRGLLCSTCNASLGFIKDDITTLRNLLKYMEKHNDTK